MKIGRMKAMGPCIMVTHWPMTLAKEPKSAKFRLATPEAAASATSCLSGVRPSRMGVPTAPKDTGKELKTKQMTAAARGGKPRDSKSGSGQCSRGAETGGTFDEGREHVADDNGLDTLVTADALHAVLDGLHAARVFEGIQNDDGTEDDNQDANGDDDALQRKRGHVADG